MMLGDILASFFFGADTYLGFSFSKSHTPQNHVENDILDFLNGGLKAASWTCFFVYDT
jgi:hypothetical protein